jgi:predicted glutamine amidotransferase
MCITVAVSSSASFLDATFSRSVVGKKMSRLFGIMCNEPERLACALRPVRESLVAEGVPDGWGLAFFQGGEVLLQRHPKSPSRGRIDFYQQARELRTDYLVGVVGEAAAANKLDNTQPFRFRSWVFALSGAVAPFTQIQSDMLTNIPDFLRRNIRGQSDVEHLFHMFLAFLHDSGKLDDPNIRTADVASALSGTIAMLDKLVTAAGAEAPALNLVTTNGRVLLAVRRGRPMWRYSANGIVDCQVCREAGPEWRPDVREDRRRVTHEHLRSVIIVSEPDKLAPAGWEEVAEGSIVSVSRDLAVSTTPVRG